ncbi:MAG: trypsin-like peptidase domain-containing protein, partial [Mucilaginibacter sp.]
NLRGDKLAAIPLGKPAVVGDPVYCISHPMTHYYYFSKGMVAGNVTIDSLAVTEKYDKIGRAPIRMEITADYGVGSSGGPIMDRHGNITGVVSSTTAVYFTNANWEGKDVTYQQMVVKNSIPVKALNDLLGK